MILDEIVNYKKREVEYKKIQKPIKLLEREIAGETRGFIKKIGKIQLIAEIKKASPSKGIIREDFEPVKLARICVDAGASALSILTEERFFKGSLEYLSSVREVVSVPILRKDFIIDEYQILESRAYGADVILLLVNILRPDSIRQFLDLSDSFGMECLVEIHTLDELKMALDTDAKIIGINNRDLRTFKVDIRNTEMLISKVPSDKIIVSESGIFNRGDVRYLEDLGVDGILVGEAIMSSEDVGGKAKELLGYDKD